MCDEEVDVVAEWPTEKNMIAELALFNESVEALETDVRFAFAFWDEENVEEFADRHSALCDRAANIAALLTAEMSDSIGVRLSALSRSLDQLRLRHEATEVPTQNSSKLRKWLQKTEWDVDRLRNETADSHGDITELQRIRAVLQTVQLEIDTDGQRLLRTTKRQIASRSIEEPWKSARYSRTLETLETRYCNLYLAIVESLERVGTFIERTKRIGDDESDRESTRSSEPPRKRSRRFPKTEEEEEDEELMSAELDLSKRRTESDEWSSSRTHDVGYSSGENSIHEVSDPQSIRMRNDGSPLSNYYRTVPLDDAGVTDTETPRSVPIVNIVLPDEPDDPTQPIADPIFDTTNDYQDVMKVIDEQLRAAMGTSWKELKSGQRRLSTPSKNRRSLPTTGKMSCDASSEDSDSQLPPALSVSFSGRSSNFLDCPIGFRKRRLTSKGIPPPAPRLTVSLSNSILKNVAMDQSIYEPQTNDQMTQSLNIPKTQRRRFIRRRIRRTASENANLGPQRDSICSDSSSTTFHDSGDAHFEWDEYKEESHVQDVPMSEDVEMNTETSLLTTLDVDEDFRTALAVDDELTDAENFLIRSTIELEGIRRLLRDNKIDKRFALNAGRLANKNLHQIRSLLQKRHSMDKTADQVCQLNEQWQTIIEKCPQIMDIAEEESQKMNNGLIDVLKRLEQQPAASSKSKETEGEHEETCSDSSVSSSDPNLRKRNNGMSNGATTAVSKTRRHSSTASAAPEQRTGSFFSKAVINCFILIGVGLFLLFLVADRDYWSRSGYLGYRYGPTLRYVNGPPPV